MPTEPPKPSNLTRFGENHGGQWVGVTLAAAPFIILGLIVCIYLTLNPSVEYGAPTVIALVAIGLVLAFVALKFYFKFWPVFYAFILPLVILGGLYGLYLTFDMYGVI